MILVTDSDGKSDCACLGDPVSLGLLNNRRVNVDSVPWEDGDTVCSMETRPGSYAPDAMVSPPLIGSYWGYLDGSPIPL